jgi:ubiquinone/menaquinone biosynthesis C-methylase UbiE
MKVCLFCSKKYQSEVWNCPNCNRSPDKFDTYIVFSPELSKENEYYSPSFFKNLFEHESSHFWFRSRNRLLLWFINKYLPDIKNLFEIGCGTGFVLSYIEKNIPMLELYGADICITGLEFASKRLSKTKLWQMNACEIPFEEEFDAICALDILEHITQDELALSQMYKALKPEGYILLTLPQHSWLNSFENKLNHNFHRYELKEVKTKLKKSGFKIIRTTSFVTLLLPLMIVSRFKQRVSYREQEELKINKFVNQILERIMGLERKMIYSGINFPVGGSLLVIAKKINSI